MNLGTSRIQKISCSQTHCASVEEGKAYAWAKCSKRGNRFGQLCRSSKRNSESSVKKRKEIKQLAGIVDVAAGGSKDPGIRCSWT